MIMNSYKKSLAVNGGDSRLKVYRRKSTLSSISFVWDAEMQNRTREAAIGVAGNPTTTTAMSFDNIYRLKALKHKTLDVCTPIS